MNWIDVRYRLPEQHIQEVICVRNINGKQPYSIPLTWRGDGFYFFLDKYIKIEDVTHWMQLPPPPCTS